MPKTKNISYSVFKTDNVNFSPARPEPKKYFKGTNLLPIGTSFSNLLNKNNLL